MSSIEVASSRSQGSFVTAQRKGGRIEKDTLYQTLIESFSEQVYSVRLRNGVLEYLFRDTQRQTFLSYVPEEQYLRPDLWHTMIHDDDRERVFNFLLRLDKEKGRGILEHRIVRKNGAVRWVANSCVATAEEDGVTRLDGFLVDITDHKIGEEELLRAKERADAATSLKDNFVSMVAHDLRSPFAGILGLLKLVVADQKDPLHPRHADLLNRVIGACQNQLDMINELLNITRIKTGKLTPQPRFFPMRHLIETAMQNLARLAEEKSVHLEANIPESLSLFGDQALIGEVLNNLLANAIKFSLKGSVVTITVSRGEHIVLTVADQGVGVSAKFAEHLFRHDVKTTSVGTAGEVGTGLGLPYCADIVKAHEGELSFASHPGKGSTFTVRLPVVKPEALVVDDDPLILDTVRMLLEMEGYGVRMALDGEEAIQLINDEPPHLLITDLAMAGLDGVGLIRYLRSTQPLAHVPVMVLTGQKERGGALFDLGVDDFVTKPVNGEELLPRVRRFLG